MQYKQDHPEDDGGEDSESEKIKKYSTYASNIYDKLKDVNYQKNIMEACRTKFYKPYMMELFDANTKLLGFENCVFDLENNILRPGHPDY